MKRKEKIENKNNKRTKRRNKGKKLIRIPIVILILLAISPVFMTFAKYVYNTFHEHYLASKDFYFSSDKLSINHSEYEVTNNWSGAQSHTITINMSSKKNDMAYTDSDITYDITYTCSSNITVTLSKTSGTIVGKGNHGVNEDSFSVTINPANGTALSAGETVWVDVVAKSTSPYKQTLSGKLILEVETADISYEIVDSANSPYLMVNIINSKSTGSNVTLGYSTSNVLLDMTNRFYINSSANTTEQINGYAYLKTITSYVNALSTTSVKFYKQDASQNYSYSAGSQNTPIITLTY